MLEVTGVTKEYVRGRTRFAAVQDASLTLRGREFASILGRSGSGKTTLLNLIAGLLRPTSGSVRIDGRDLAALSDAQGAFLRNSRIGYVPQGYSALGNLSVLDNVALPFYFFHRGGDAMKKAMYLLGKVGIAHLADARPKELSGGELRRVCVARALINGPALLLADEPTGDLDAKTTAQVMELFRSLAGEGAAVLVATHDRDVLSYSDRAYRMDRGRLESDERE